MRSRYLDVDDRSKDLADLMADEPALAQEFLKKYELSWLHHENALEGVVYTSAELEHALAHQPVAEASSLAMLREIRNHKAAVDLVRQEAAGRKARISLALVKKLYEVLGAGFESRSVAEYRKEIPLHRAYFHEIAQPARIAPMLAKLMEWCDSSDFRSAHAIHAASKLQHGFMAIYPFTDNSGKIARLLSNLVLLHGGYLPCIIHAIERQRYYESLKLPEVQLRELMIDSIHNGLANAEKFFRLARDSRTKRTAR
jgi:Fic family protein